MCTYKSVYLSEESNDEIVGGGHMSFISHLVELHDHLVVLHEFLKAHSRFLLNRKTKIWI